ncbi:uncharacterized protein EV420DRAFT_926076 [Desarmillaria tabescens]|uniref:F-box domain-containing protein n=1 Tax=Armillaria tabescens TaxID=1929756 RepID=A0AA39NFV4_ARMTA|nr:uncharacterized protein EV420DRAFT_926076 [Desarmillaria tabescens]KAK0464882.1 hypothetical protein EV420DRAFT_926076 [Desarmillaria tabescens]
MTRKKNKGKKQDATSKIPKPKPSSSKSRRGTTKSTGISRINERLPNELLAYIFSTAIISLLPINHRSFLAQVCSICRRWRDVAIEASELWTTIVIHNPNHVPSAELFLERSKTRLLDVDVQVAFGQGGFRGPSATFSRQSGLRVAELTSVHLWRTRTLSLSISDTQGAEKFSALYRPVSTPHLVSLSVYVKGWSQNSPPLLDSICSVGSNGNGGLSSNTTSVSGLTRLELTSVHPKLEDVRKIFTHFPSLETLILSQFCPGWAGRQEVNQPTISTSSSLRSLAVHLDYSHVKSSHAGNPPDCSCVLGSLRFPNLEYLEVLGDNSSYSLNLGSHFKDLPKLKTLRLQRCSVLPADTEFFRSLKLLNRLELVDNLKDVKWSAKHRKRATLPFPHLSSILLGDKSNGNYDMSQWISLARLAIQSYGCTKFSIEVPARYHRSMSRTLGPQDERIHVEAKDHLPGLLCPPPPVYSFQWSDDDEDYYDSDFDIDSVYGFDSSDYENQAEYYAGY